MELRHIRYFLTVAEELHFGHAAERLHVSQPPLSQQIRQLEAELGVMLLERNQRNVQLTEAGKLYARDMRELLSSLEEAGLRARQAAEGIIGSLSVGFVASAIYSLLPRIYRRFRTEYPKVSLSLDELSTAEQIEALHAGRIHVGIGRPPIGDSTLDVQLLVDEPLAVAMPAHHPLANRDVLDLAELSSEPFVLFPRRPRPGWLDIVREACEQAGFVPNVAQEVQELSSAVTLAAAGIGLTVVPASAEALSLPDLAYKHLSDKTPKTRLVTLRRTSDVSPLIENFLHIAREVVGS